MAWFEIKAIRPWVPGRRGATVFANGHGVASRSTEQRVLGEVLATYDRRCQEEETRDRTDAERHEHFRAEATRILEKVIVPTLAELGREIADHGHDWNVGRRVDILGQPAIACSFRPRHPGKSAGGPSELVFRFHFPDRLLATATSDDGTGIRELPPRSHEMAAIDASTIRSEVTRFVRRVLGVTG